MKLFVFGLGFFSSSLSFSFFSFFLSFFSFCWWISEVRHQLLITLNHRGCFISSFLSIYLSVCPSVYSPELAFYFDIKFMWLFY